jgi:ATP-dependent Zn protease
MYNILLIKKKHQISEEKIKFVAKQTQGLSGADMENITNESAYLAIEK